MGWACRGIPEASGGNTEETWSAPLCEYPTCDRQLGARGPMPFDLMALTSFLLQIEGASCIRLVLYSIANIVAKIYVKLYEL